MRKLVGLVAVAPMRSAQEEVSAGSFTLRLANRFESPVTVTVTPSRAPSGARLQGLPPTMQMSPREEVERAVRFESSEPLPVGRAEFRVRVFVEREVESGTAEQFEDEIRLRIQSAATVPDPPAGGNGRNQQTPDG